MCAYRNEQSGDLEIDLADCKQMFALVRSELGIYTYLYGKPLVELDNLKCPLYSAI